METPMRLPAASIVCLAMVALSGCASNGPSEQTVHEEEAVTIPPATSVRAVSDPTRISYSYMAGMGNRIADFMVAQHPRDPDHLVVAFVDYDSRGGVLNCAFAVSFNGGETWTLSDPVPGFTGHRMNFNPWVAFDARGGVHAICLGHGGVGTTTQMWPFHIYSDSGGLFWDPPSRIPTEADRGADKGVLGVGRDGTIYGAASGLVGRSKDNGATWEPMSSFAADFGKPNGMVKDNNGTMFLVGLGGGQVKVQRTPDSGETWTETSIGTWRIPPGYDQALVDQRPWPALPSIDHDPVTDDLYVAYQGWDESKGGYEIQLYRSTDGGITFNATAVPDFTSPTCVAPCHITHPSIALDKHGRIGMVVQLTKDGGHLKEVYFSASADHGATWLAPFELSKTDGIQQGWSNPQAQVPYGSFYWTEYVNDPTIVYNQAVGSGLTTTMGANQLRWNGEYWDLAASSKGFVAMWIEHGDGGRPQLWSRILAVE